MNLGERETERERDREERGEDFSEAWPPRYRTLLERPAIGAHSVENDGYGWKVKAIFHKEWLREMKMSAL